MSVGIFMQEKFELKTSWRTTIKILQQFIKNMKTQLFQIIHTYVCMYIYVFVYRYVSSMDMNLFFLLKMSNKCIFYLFIYYFVTYHRHFNILLTFAKHILLFYENNVQYFQLLYFWFLHFNNLRNTFEIN